MVDACDLRLRGAARRPARTGSLPRWPRSSRRPRRLRRLQARQPQQVVGGAGDQQLLMNPPASDESRPCQPADNSHPAEDLLDAFADPLADPVPLRPGPTPCFALLVRGHDRPLAHRHVRHDLVLLQVIQERPVLVSLVRPAGTFSSILVIRSIGPCLLVCLRIGYLHPPSRGTSALAWNTVNAKGLS